MPFSITMRGVSVWLMPVLCNSRPSVITIVPAAASILIAGAACNRLLRAHLTECDGCQVLQGAAVGFINIGDGGQYVYGERAPGIQRNILILVQGLGNAAFNEMAAISEVQISLALMPR